MTNEIVSNNQSLGIYELRKTARLQKWQQELADQQNSGLSIKEWCAEHNLCPSAFYRRLKKLRQSFCDEVSNDCREPEPPQAIVPVSTFSKCNSGIQISSSGIDISINGDISAENLKAIIQSLKSC